MFYSVSCTTVARSACMSDVESEYIWHCNLNDLALNEVRFVTPCLPLCVTFNSCSFNSLEKKRHFTIDLHGSEVWGRFILPLERASYGSLAMQIWLGSSWAVVHVPLSSFCRVVHVPTRAWINILGWWKFPVVHFLVGLYAHACQKNPLAQNHIRVQKLETLCSDTRLQRDHLVFRGFPLIF